MGRGVRVTAVLTVLAGLAWLAVGAAPPAAGGDVLVDEWRALYLAGQKAGFEHLVTRKVSAAESAFFVTHEHSEISVARAGIPLQMKIDSVVREDERGRVVEFHYTSPLAGSTEGVLQADQFMLTTIGALGPKTRRATPPAGFGPWAFEQLIRQKGYEPGTSYSAEAFCVETPEKPMRVSVLVGPKEKVLGFGADKWLHLRTVSNSLLPGLPSQEWFDDEGTVWLSRTSLAPQIEVESRKATREEATAPAQPAELLTNSYVIPDLPIRRPRELECLQMLLTPTRAGAPAPELPQDVGQQVRSLPQGLLVSVQRVHPPKSGYALPYSGEEYADLLRANKWLEVDDPLIQKMAREAVGGSTDSVMAARRIEAYVERKIRTKDLSVGMATAAQTARQLEGDCSEHAMLAAALARAAGMPSRIVGGLAYVESLPGTEKGGFGYHMWAEVYVGQWFPIDATLGGHDATHIALFRSGMNEPGAEFAMARSILQFLGRVQVHIMRATY